MPIFRVANFGIKFLPASESPIETLQVRCYTHLDLRLETGIFRIRAPRKKLQDFRSKIAAGRISPKPYRSSKIQKTGHFGGQNLLKTLSKHFRAVTAKKFLTKKEIFLTQKNPDFGAPYAPCMSANERKSAFRFRFGSRRSSGASLIKIGLGLPRVPLVRSANLRCNHS